MKALFFLAIAVIACYIAYTIYAFNKIPKSISDTYYQWAERGAKYLFTAVMWLTGFLLLPYWIYVSPTNLQFIPFLSLCGMFFVGGACAKNETLTRGVHFTAAGIWAGFALLYFALLGNWTAIIAGAASGLVAIIADWERRKHYIFWLECAVVLTMIIGISML